MRLWRRFLPRSLTAQITLIVAVSVILGVLLVVSSVLVFFNGGPRHNLSVTAARIADVSFMVQGARSHDEAAAIIIAARRTGLRVTLVALDDLETSPKPPELSLARKLVADQLEATWGVDVIEGARLRGDGVGYLAVRAGDYSALLFEMSAELSLWRIVLAPTVLTLTIVVVLMTLLSVYAVRWIIAPLRAVAAAAHSFGRSPDDNRSMDHSGPREIA